MQYWRNMLYGWYFERLLEDFLKLNLKIKKVELYGTDRNHDVELEKSKKLIKIVGQYTTTPDFKITLEDNIEWAIEVLTATKGVFTIKEPKVNRIKRTYGEDGLHTFFIMFDVVNFLYSIVGPSYFHGKVAFPNNRMEGKMCFDFKTPDKPIKNLLEESFDEDIKEIEKDWSIYKERYNPNTTKEEKRINEYKIKIKRLEDEKLARIKALDTQILKYKDIVSKIKNSDNN